MDRQQTRFSLGYFKFHFIFSSLAPMFHGQGCNKLDLIKQKAEGSTKNEEDLHKTILST
jgi:hypothetical protein